MTWRVGRKLGRTLYIQAGAEPDCDGGTNGDTFIGLMETRELAQLVCDSVNAFAELHRQHDLEPRVAQPVGLGQTLLRKEHPPTGPTVQRSVDPGDTGSPVVAVDGDDRCNGIPEHDGPVPAVPPDTDLPVVELHPLGDDADARDT